MQGLRCHFISMSDIRPTKLEVISRHDHSCLLGRKTSNQSNKQIYFISYVYHGMAVDPLLHGEFRTLCFIDTTMPNPQNKTY